MRAKSEKPTEKFAQAFYQCLYPFPAWRRTYNFRGANSIAPGKRPRQHSSRRTIIVAVFISGKQNVQYKGEIFSRSAKRTNSLKFEKCIFRMMW
jgi:hypothetical protein